MKQGRATLRLLAIAALVCWAGAASAEEIILKDGQKVVGTIVGYENNMFRVETDYGVALVRKDKVASVQVAKPDDASAKAGAPKPSETKPSGEKPARAAAGPETAPRAGASRAATEKTPAPQPSETKPSAEKPARAAAGPEAPPRAGTLRAATETTPAQPAPTAVSHPLDVPLPANLQEHVEGSTYINDTFQFSMFKPPDWMIYEGVSKETGSGIMAMGAEDEQTLLFVDRQVWSGTPNLSSDQVEAKLRQPYQEYRKISEESFQCDGLPAIRRTFTGVLDGAEWHGVAVYVAHGNMVFGVVGLTSAEMFEFQQAIFSKVIKTFHFLTPAPPAAVLGTAHSSP
ncbi:MAG: hypothetical protein ABSA41_02115 [Terriglobia bacterium]|jgi:hypothetical protein